jgi:hypothetical protein
LIFDELFKPFSEQRLLTVVWLREAILARESPFLTFTLLFEELCLLALLFEECCFSYAAA